MGSVGGGDDVVAMTMLFPRRPPVQSCPPGGYGSGIERAWLGTLGGLGVPVLVALALTLATGSPEAGADTTRPQGGPRFDARAVYLRDCATCHGSGGEGSPRGPSIVDAGGSLTDYELTTGRMPIAEPDDPVRRGTPRYAPAEIDALVDHVASFGDGPPVPTVDLPDADVARGGELWRLNCAACHSWSGTGGALLGREAPSVHPSTPVQVAEAVRTGPGSMPSFGEESFSDAEVADLAAYVRELQHPDDRGGNPLLRLGPFPEGAVAWVFGMGALLLFVTWVGEREEKS
jgi:ubiquinol-cytochrome c reductase cytochrome c subunit